MRDTPTPEAHQPVLTAVDRPHLASHIRLTFDSSRRQYLLLAPERVSVLNHTGAAILNLCDGYRTVAAIVAELGRRYSGVSADEVHSFLSQFVDRQWMEVIND